VLLDPDGAPLSFRTHKHLALLVYLALEARDREIPRDYLIDLLWPQAPHVRGRHSLAQALSVIRQLLGRQVLSRGGRAVQVLGNLVTDIDVMAAGGDPPSELGEPLEGLDHLGGVTFAHWLDITRERLRRTARECLAGQLETARSSGDGRRVHERAVQLYRVDPLSDTAVQALCERLLNDGDAVAAASLLRNHVERVESEAGLPTPPGLKRLLVLLECGHLATRRIDRSARRAWQHRPPEIFVGRERELSRLESQWSAVVEGNRRTCLVAGPTGIGKSSLLSRFSTSVVARSATVCEVACQEIGQNIPFAAVSDFIIALARYPGAGSVEGRWLAEASRVAPGVRSWWDGIPDPPPVPADAVRLRVAETLVRMIDAAREGEPMVLVLDDLGYLDPASRDILHLLSRRLHDSPLLIVASARTAEEASLMIGDPVGRAGMSWDEIISLEPLDADHVRQMVADLCGDRGPLDECTLRTIVELAQGNPYLVEMLLSDWRRQPEASLVIAHVRGDVTATRWRPPTTMLQAFERQHRGLSGEAERVLNLLAVAGRRLPADDIGRLLRLEEATADSAYMQLLDRAILRVEDGGLSFKNQVHRSFVYDAMAEGTRRFLHGKVGLAWKGRLNARTCGIRTSISRPTWRLTPLHEGQNARTGCLVSSIRS
jgi:DNA-binding SARP family transcriptional activator